MTENKKIIRTPEEEQEIRTKSKYNFKVLIVANVLRCLFGYLIVFKTNIQDVFKVWLLYFSGRGSEGIDSFYLKFFKILKPIKKDIFKTDEKNDIIFRLYLDNQDKYNIPDKISDLFSNIIFYDYLKKKNYSNNYLLLLLFVIINRGFGCFMYFFKNKWIFPTLKIDRKVFFHYPEYSSFLFLCLPLVQNKKIPNILLLMLLKALKEREHHGGGYGKNKFLFESYVIFYKIFYHVAFLSQINYKQILNKLKMKLK